MLNPTPGRLRNAALAVALAVLAGCSDPAPAPPAVAPLDAAQAAARTQVPLTRPVALDEPGVIADLEFDLPPPGPSADSTLIVGVRIEEQKAKAMLARSGMIAKGGLPARIRLQNLSGTHLSDIMLTRIGDDLNERVPLGPDGLTPGVRQESVNGAMLRDVGLIKPGTIYNVLAFGFAVAPPPGRYQLSVELLEKRPQLKGQQAELVIAYNGKSK
ncbi:hypothetical protein EDF77_2871 [Stenotrophomonas maltophilia]|uniref:hypothetical protein n=1 Tax=Stenotrophomonas chelatiphaga TaxID=517011 RepID=UPI000FB2E17C|nr:hypothetical protein [Stenotrophomonas chelatiphaga]MCS4231143.1 hypothetical protein [Stenotrophomonas chelatiphaga]ROQ39048.1 hypothetical protein EDF77_2871 [Stenotrophomonas maltophilia]